MHAQAPHDRNQVNLMGNIIFDFLHCTEEAFVFLEAQAPLAGQTSQQGVVIKVLRDGNARLFLVNLCLIFWIIIEVVLLLVPGVESVGNDGRDFVLGDEGKKDGKDGLYDT